MTRQQPAVFCGVGAPSSPPGAGEDIALLDVLS